MKFKKKRRGDFQLTQSPGFRTNVQQRKQRRKEERKQKKKNRAEFATRHQRKKISISGDNQQNANFPPNRIQHLKDFAESEKKKLRGENKSTKAAPEPVNKAENLSDTRVSLHQEGETEGFKISSSVNDRLARLQEFVNQEAGISRVNDSKKKSKNRIEPNKSVLEDKKGDTIKDKQKLQGLQSGLKDDTKEINKLAKLLGYKPYQKKKIAPVFADDFGGLLDDIEEGSMASAKKYENDDNDAHDSDEDFEKDMAIALGQKEEIKRGKIKEGFGIDTDVENMCEDFMNDDFKAFESGVDGEEGVDQSDEDCDIDNTNEFDEFNDVEASSDDNNEESYAGSESDKEEGELGNFESSYTTSKVEHPSSPVEDSDANHESDEDCDFDNTNEFDEFNDVEASSDDNDAENYAGSDSDKEEGELGNFESSYTTSKVEHPSSPVEDSDANHSSFDKSEEDDEESSGFLDSQAEECSDEESDNDEELVHDLRKEYELAFEGGSSYSKPEILKNGQENDIDKYSSNSDDDEDLEDFVVDDNEVEFENVSDELPNELSDSSPIKKRRRLIVDDDSDEDDHDESKKLENVIPSEDVDDVPLIPRNRIDISEKIRKRKQQNPKKKSDTDVRNECNEQEREVKDSLSDKTLEKKKRVLTSSGDEDEICGPKPRRKKIRKETRSDGEDSDNPLQKSTKKRIRTILKKGNSLENSHSSPKCKRKDMVSFVLPSVSEDESTPNEEKEDFAKGNRKTKGEKPSLHTGNRIWKFLKIPDISDDSDSDLEGTNQFDDNEENELLDSSEFSDDENESLGSAKFSEDGEDAQGIGSDVVSEIQGSAQFSDNEESESGDSAEFSDDENESCGSAKFSDDGEDIHVTEFDEKTQGSAQINENEENESLGSAEFSKDENESFGSAEFSDAEEATQDITGKDTAQEKEKDGIREDIYGRYRDREGNIIQDEDSDGAGNGRYVPPALRKLMALNTSEKKKEQLDKLRKTIKGLLNRLAESNMAGIASQIEGMYTKQSHNDLNEMLTNLFFESLVAPTLTPERLVQEHAMLVAVLSTNVGSEVGAHILNEFVLRWNDEMQQVVHGEDIDTKELDNLLLFLANLYNFRVMNARLIYDILHKLALSFTNKEVELILLVLRSVGFTLRKEDPLALKSLITKIQTQASITETKNEDNKEYSRVRFMLEVVQALRNNNVAKVPNYDPSHVQHLKKVLKGLVRKGNQAAQLNITLEDLLKARECGRWWIVGSAWSRDLPREKLNPDQELSGGVKGNTGLYNEFSEKFKERAAKLQLSRPPRINILYVVTEGSEDYLDAFEKLLQLSLPPQQERELFNVILLCCQKGKVYNPFFAHLSDRMCNFDKKYKRLLQFALWDKFKEVESLKPREAANLAKFVTHLIGENSLNLSVFKNISFMEVDSQMISFLRQILIALLLHPAGADSVERIFSELSASPKLRILRQSLRIFILKFLSAKKNKENADHLMLSKRIQDVTEILGKGGGLRL